MCGKCGGVGSVGSVGSGPLSRTWRSLLCKVLAAKQERSKVRALREKPNSQIRKGRECGRECIEHMAEITRQRIHEHSHAIHSSNMVLLGFPEQIQSSNVVCWNEVNWIRAVYSTHWSAWHSLTATSSETCKHSHVRIISCEGQQK